jgi:ribosome-binding protein aMBF1 (putative translation factor)
MIEGQWRAARALIGWSQSDLAEKIGVAVLTIKRMEAGAQNVSDDIRERAKAALEGAGVEFTNGGQPGVRLRKEFQEGDIARAMEAGDVTGITASMNKTGKLDATIDVVPKRK